MLNWCKLKNFIYKFFINGYFFNWKIFSIYKSVKNIFKYVGTEVFFKSASPEPSRYVNHKINFHNLSIWIDLTYFNLM